MFTRRKWTIGILLSVMLSSLGSVPVYGQSDAGEYAIDAEGRPDVLYSSMLWKKGKHAIEGSDRVERRGDTQTLVLDERFKTKDGPELKIILSPHRLDIITKRNALDRGIVLGVLRRFEGSSEFELAIREVPDHEPLEWSETCEL